MRIYKDLELVEHLGSGLNRILEIYDKDSFVIKQNYMKNIFYKNENPLNEGVNIELYPNNRAPFFAKELNTSVKNIERWLKQLKEEDKIEFRGSPKTGGYVTKCLNAQTAALRSQGQRILRMSKKTETLV